MKPTAIRRDASRTPRASGRRLITLAITAALATQAHPQSASALAYAASAMPASPTCDPFGPEVAVRCEPLDALADRLTEAVTASPSLARQRSVGQEADLRIDEVRATRRPQFSIGLEQRNAISDIDRNAFDQGSRVDAVARVSQLLWDFGASGASLDSAELDAEAERWATVEETRQTVLRALDAYYDVLRHDAQIDLAELNLREHEELLDAVSRRAQGGAGGQAEVLRARGRVAEARSQLVSLRGGLARAENRYVELFFASPDGGGLPILPPPPVTDVEAGLDDALAEHPGLSAALRRTDAAFAALKAERRGRLPRMTLEFQGRQLNVDDARTDDRSLALLVNLQYSPYQGGQQNARIGQANERLRQARFERAAIRRELENAYLSAFTDVEASRATWEAQAATVEAEQAAIDGYRTQFSIGRRTLMEVLEAQRDLFQSQLQMVDSRMQWDLARYQLMAMENRLLSTFSLTDLAEPAADGVAAGR